MKKIIKFDLIAPNNDIVKALWIRIVKIDNVNEMNILETIFDSKFNNHCEVDQFQTIKIDVTIPKDDIYEFDGLYLDGERVSVPYVTNITKDMRLAAKARFIDYKLIQRREDVEVRKENILLLNNSIVHYGDELNIFCSDPPYIIGNKKYFNKNNTIIVSQNIRIKK